MKFNRDDNESAIVVIDNKNYNTFEPSIEITKDSTKFDLYKGLIFMLFSCLCKSIYSLLTKILFIRNPRLSPFQLLTFKAYFMVAISFIIMLYIFFSKRAVRLFDFKTRDMYQVTFRAIICISCNCLILTALKGMNISDLYSIFYTYPGIVMILSYFVLRERITKLDCLCLLTSFLGVMLIIRPSGPFGSDLEIKHIAPILVGFVVAGSFLKAYEDTLLRDIGTRIYFVYHPVLYSICGILIYPVTMCLARDTFVTLDNLEYILIACIGVLSYSCQLLMALGFQNESAARVSMINYLQVPLLFVFDIFLFNKTLILYDVLGISLIIGFNILNGTVKALKRNKDLETIKEIINKY
jgi:drug/metabolite transporter (DMT)-like permease